VAASLGYTVTRYTRSCSSPTIYCTAKTNSAGCDPEISWVGIPSASFGSGCTLSTVNVLGAELGIFSHSTSGGQMRPFHGGFMCVSRPLVRHAVLNSGGTHGSCDGIYAEDFNAYIASRADPALVPGASVWIQNWSFDPGDPFGDGLSDALSATICP
jgi:hypothetical protein